MNIFESNPVLAAPTEIGDWIQGVVVAIIILGSMLSGVAKAIIKKKQERDERRKGPASQPSRPRYRPIGSADGHSPPAAQPVPPRHLPPRRATPMTGQPETMRGRREVGSPPQPIRLPQTMEELFETLHDMSQRRPAQTNVYPPEQVAAPPPPRLQRQPKTPARRIAKTPPPAPSRASAESIEARERRRARQLEVNLGHVDEGVVAPLPEEVEAPIGPAVAMGLNDRSALRRAIVYREILDRPLALRDLEEF